MSKKDEHKKNQPAPPPPPPKPDKKPPKKRGGGCLLMMIILLILIIIALLLLNYFGLFGVGNGKNDGDGSNESSQSSSIVDRDDEPSSEPQVYADITVSGDQYIYENANTDINDITDSVKSMDGNVLVRITDQDASFNAMENLKKALDDADIAYSEVHDNN